MTCPVCTSDVEGKVALVKYEMSSMLGIRYLCEVYLRDLGTESVVQCRIDKLGIEANMKNMGVLMKSTMAELKDKADGSAVNKAVKEFLSGK